MWIARPAKGINIDVHIDTLPFYESKVCGCFAAHNEIVHVSCLNREGFRCRLNSIIMKACSGSHRCENLLL